MARASVPSAGLDLNIGVVMNKRVSADVFYSQLEYVQLTLRFSRLVSTGSFPGVPQSYHQGARRGSQHQHQRRHLHSTGL
jgi:hypothetical protein